MLHALPNMVPSGGSMRPAAVQMPTAATTIFEQRLGDRAVATAIVLVLRSARNLSQGPGRQHGRRPV